jgi:uncharacterized membrane protein YqhA
MAQMLQRGRYIVVVGVASLLLSSVAAFIWALVEAVNAVALILVSQGQDSHIAIVLVQVIDSVLIASVLLVSAVSLYEIFIDRLDLPSGMVAHNLYELKGKLGSIVVLVMALKFLEHLVEWKEAGDTLLYAAAIAAVSAVLIALSYLGNKDQP